GNGYYFDEGAKNLLIGKKDAYLTLPAFGYDVEKSPFQSGVGSICCTQERHIAKNCNAKI
ncbi:MAG: hypothetical protein II030_00505, partial [Treponema sp.]|nr:hypothetical protein [Treponema sp.]